MTTEATASLAVGSTGTTELPQPCGPVSRSVIAALRQAGPGHPASAPAWSNPSGSVLEDRDQQLALWLLHELHYRGFVGVPDAAEWDPELLALRRSLEDAHLAELREQCAPRVAALDDGLSVPAAIVALIDADDAPSVASHLQRHGTRAQVSEYLVERSPQQLKESDPQAFVLPRLSGRAKVALAELLYDEFGAGRPADLHQRLYAEAMTAAGLDAAYAAYVGEVSATALAAANTMSVLGLRRELRGAAMGHFAAFEATSALPSRRIAAAVQRVGFGTRVAAYFVEHMEADSVHEHLAAEGVCGAMVEAEPHLRDDVLWGAAVCLHLEAMVAGELLTRWAAAGDESALERLGRASVRAVADKELARG
jgi:hypothetical protein